LGKEFEAVRASRVHVSDTIMQVRLIVKTQRNRRVLTINRAVAVVGRAKGCSVRIPESDVSRRHCRIAQKDGFVVIEDLKSLNGTFVNGERITAAHIVRPGDAVDVGPMRFIVGYELTPAAKARMENFVPDVELMPADSGPDFLEDVEGVEWVEEDPFEIQVDDAAEVPEPSGDEEKLTQYKNGSRVLEDDDSWVLPTDLQLTDLLEPIDEDEAQK
jgi:predicted component of type VI protein secretion system